MIAAGMFVGTLFTLFVVPTFYLLGSAQPVAQTSAPSQMPQGSVDAPPQSPR